MSESGHLIDVLILLAASVFVVSVFHRLRPSPVVGYLVAGVLVGPYALGLLGYDPSVEALAHFGVVFLLFTIGLELPLERLWVMRRLVLGLGLGQVFMTSLAGSSIRSEEPQSELQSLMRNSDAVFCLKK